MKARLGLCSAYSFLYGVHQSEKLLKGAVSFGADTVSICDLNSLYGVHTFLEAAKEENVRPIIGTVLTAGESTIPGVYCFVENPGGFARLCEILTIRSRDSEHFDPLPLLRENAAGLILASPNEAALAYLNGKVKKLYGAITPRDIKVIPCSRNLGLPLAFLDDSLFLDPKDMAVHRVLRAVGLLKTIGNLAPGDTAHEDRVLRSPALLHRRLMSWPEAARGTEEIAALCTTDHLFDKLIFPGYATPGHTAHEELVQRVYRGNTERYGNLGDKEITRIEHELDIIKKKSFSSYFLIIDDIVKMASRTCGRGSGAASIVSYGLGITNVDPVRYNLYFERFLNPSRPDPPDLDIDFAWDERDDLIKAVIERFGIDHCARVANHNMFRRRSALRETAKAYGFGDGEITAIERKLAIRKEEREIIGDDPIWEEDDEDLSNDDSVGSDYLTH